MFDLERVKSSIDLLALAERDTTLKRIASCGGGEYGGPCPFCGGRDRFRVQPEAYRWLCRGCTQGKWQSSIDYIMRRQRCNLRTACEYLGTANFLPNRSHTVAPKPARSEPAAGWQANARSVITQCVATLWSDKGTKAREWLNNRGLNDDTLHLWELGYLPGRANEWRQIHGLSVPCGITIPGQINGTVHYVKVRRAGGEPKYEQVRGGHPTLFGARTLQDKHTAILTEGEFDAMLLYQVAGDLVGVATMGSATAHPTDVTMRYLLPVPVWLIAYDLDEAGEQGARWWTNKSRRARRAWIPKIVDHVKDLSDFHNAGGNLRQWVEFQVWGSGGGA